METNPLNDAGLVLTEPERGLPGGSRFRIHSSGFQGLLDGEQAEGI